MNYELESPSQESGECTLQQTGGLQNMGFGESGDFQITTTEIPPKVLRRQRGRFTEPKIP